MQFVIKASPRKHVAGKSFFTKIHLLKKLSKVIQKFVRVRTSVPIMKLETVVFGVMWAVMRNCKSTICIYKYVYVYIYLYVLDTVVAN